METISIIVKGKVQGVYFRHFAREKAHNLELTGYVKNHPDFSVYILAHGEKSALDNFVAWCHNGSPESFVKELIIDRVVESQIFDGFEIIR